MPQLIDLPLELLHRITSYLELQTATNLRLVCTAVTEAATDRVFSNVVLRPTLSSAEGFLWIVNTADLAKRVRSCDFFTCERETDDGVNAEEKVLPECWDTCFDQFNKFPHLSAVSLIFSPGCTSPETDGWEYPESVEFRTGVLRRFWELLNQEESVDVLEVSIVNLQNLNDESITTSENFQEVLERLKSLKIHIATEENEPSPEYTLHHSEFQTFMDELPDTWLTPIAGHIRSLSLVQDEPFGYLPRLDLRSVHLPQLQSLHFGNWTFTHDWQLDWLVKHHATLQELLLFDCAIIYHILPNGPVDSEGYYAEQYDAEEDSVEGADFKYVKRWHNFFDRFREELPLLQHFRIGVQPSQAAWSERELPVALSHKRYMAFRGGGMPTPWIYDAYAYVPGRERQKEYEELDDEPECDGQDREALVRLLEKIGQAKVPNQEFSIHIPGMKWKYSYTVKNWMGR